MLKRVIQQPRHRRAQVCLAGETFSCRLETDWNGVHRGVYPRFPVFHGVAMPCLKFGYAAPWGWILDLKAHETDAGVAVLSQGYRELEGRRIPFLRTRRFFWRDPEMLYEVSESQHLEPVTYAIQGIPPDELTVSADCRRAEYRRAGVVVCWQFAPTPVWARPDGGGWSFRFDTANVEVLVTWAKQENEEPPPRFVSITDEIESLRVHGPRGQRSFRARDLHECVEPDERLCLPADEVLFTGQHNIAEDHHVALGSDLADLAVRRRGSDTVALGSARVFGLDRLAASEAFPMLKPSLVRAMRSLKERMVFGVVPEDDPEQLYQWGTGTWPRCFSVLCFDAFGFHEEAYAYLEFMLDASRQFEPFDELPHLWDNFYITGPRINERLRDINGHSIKLYEAGKFYLNHRGDGYAARLLDEHYDTLRGWCAWIERHMAEDGAVLDETESNVWSLGYGAFTQAPAAAGVHLFVRLARDAGRTDDATHFAAVVKRLMNGLNTRLFGDAANPYLDIPEGLGQSYLTYVPAEDAQRNWWDQPVQSIGLACYSLAPHYFLQDPQVGLLAPDDARARQTLDLALEHLGDRFDPRIVTWHIRRVEAHMGYGQGHLLQALVYAGREDAFRERLQALFDVSTREIGDIYLMQEVLARRGNPNRGNKAHLTYYPVLMALLAGFAPDGAPLRKFIPDLVERH